MLCDAHINPDHIETIARKSEPSRERKKTKRNNDDIQIHEDKNSEYLFTAAPQ